MFGKFTLAALLFSFSILLFITETHGECIEVGDECHRDQIGICCRGICNESTNKCECTPDGGKCGILSKYCCSENCEGKNGPFLTLDNPNGVCKPAKERPFPF